MRFIIIFYFIVFTINSAWAKWSYEIDKETLIKPSITDLYEISEHFTSLGYPSSSDLSLSQIQLPFDKVFSNFGMTKNFTIKAGLRPPDHLLGEPIFISDLSLRIFHFIHNDTPYLLIGYGFENSEKEFNQAILPWKKKVRKSVSNFFISSAYADESCEIPGSKMELSATSHKISADMIMKRIAECGLHAVQGAKTASSDTLEIFKKLATNPAQLWRETKESFYAIKSVISNIDIEIRNIFKQMGSLSLSTQLDVACQISGEVFIGILPAILTGPMAISRVIPNTILRLKKIGSDISKYMSLKRKGMKLPNEKKVIEEVIRCG